MSSTGLALRSDCLSDLRCRTWAKQSLTWWLRHVGQALDLDLYLLGAPPPTPPTPAAQAPQAAQPPPQPAAEQSNTTASAVDTQTTSSDTSPTASNLEQVHTATAVTDDVVAASSTSHAQQVRSSQAKEAADISGAAADASWQPQQADHDGILVPSSVEGSREDPAALATAQERPHGRLRRMLHRRRKPAEHVSSSSGSTDQQQHQLPNGQGTPLNQDALPGVLSLSDQSHGGRHPASTTRSHSLTLDASASATEQVAAVQPQAGSEVVMPEQGPSAQLPGQQQQGPSVAATASAEQQRTGPESQRQPTQQQGAAQRGLLLQGSVQEGHLQEEPLLEGPLQDGQQQAQQQQPQQQPQQQQQQADTNATAVGLALNAQQAAYDEGQLTGPLLALGLLLILTLLLMYTAALSLPCLLGKLLLFGILTLPI